jgi:hypothetical protein
MSAPLRARPTVYRGIAMRSRLEAHFAAALDRVADRGEWSYEPRAYADETGQYLPDFELCDSRHFVEVKPTRERALEAIDRARIVFASEPDAIVWIVWPVSTPDGDWRSIEVSSSGWHERTSV